MKKQCLLTFLLSVCVVFLFAQTPPALPTQNVMPKSPQAAAFEKFVDMPVSLHTGIPKINIPIYEIKLKELSIPIELNYHASGIKINEVASNVGLGWSLSAGGMINISTHGLSDFEQNGWIKPFIKIPKEATIRTKFEFLLNGVRYEDDPDYLLAMNTVNGLNDSEPDLFSYSFPGKSGKFFFDQEGGYHLMPFDDLQVSYAQDSSLKYPSSFSIKDAKGNLFVFGMKETMYTTGATVCQGNSTDPGYSWFGKNLATCYYITQIKTVKNEVVTFTYDMESYRLHNTPTDFRYARLSDLSECQVQSSFCRTSSKTDAHVPRIATISTNTGERIEFKYSLADRLDLAKSKSLESVEVYNGAASKKVKLSYDYYRSGPAESVDPFEHRLKLTEVAEVGKPGYKLSYNSSSLPRRFSNGQDHWGFNNGRNGMISNGSLLPQSTTFREFNDGVSREPDSMEVSVGMISRLTYPTGGYVLFDFEPNRVYNEETRPVITIGGTTVSANLDEEVKSESFTSPAVATKMRAKWDTGSPRGQMGYSTISITGPNGFIKRLVGRVDDYVELPELIAGQTYTINVTRPSSPDITFMGLVSLNWDIVVNTHFKENLLTGGTRIKSVSHYDNNERVLFKRYEYDAPGTVNRSSADVFFKPSYEHKVYNGRTYQINDGYHCPFIMQVSNSLADLNAVEGGNIVYTNVNVFEGDRSNGYTSHEFLSDKVSQRFIAFPFPSKVVNHWMNGLPLKTTQYQYDRENKKYFPVHVVQNFFKSRPYEGLNDYSVRGVKIGVLRPEWMQFLPIGITQVTEFSIENFNLYSTRCHLDSVRETLFDRSGLNPVVTLKKFQYTNPSHARLTKTESVNSEGKLVTETYQYVPEKSVSAGGVYTEMNNLHMSDYLTEKATYHNHVLKTREKADYSKFNINNYEPSVIEAAIENTAPHVLWRYHKYDTLGNVLSQSKDGGLLMNYLWSYNGRYPIAEIKNATYTAIESFLGKDAIEKFKKMENPDKATIDAFIDPLIIALSEAYVLKFSYKPGVGIETSTDEKRMTIYYIYDDFQRLKSIKDHNGHIIKSYEYNYQH